MQVSTIGIDLAKNVFQVHGIDGAGKVAITKKLRRSQVMPLFEKLPRCLIGMEACATSHHWARELKALGYDVRLMPASYVKAYVKRNKNDAADAAAICEAVTRPTMRFVPIKSPEQQSILMLHRTRDLLVRQRTQLINAMRAHLAELGLVAPRGGEGLQALIMVVRDGTNELPDLARRALQALLGQLDALARQIAEIERDIQAQHRLSEASRRLETIPGIGIIGATATVPRRLPPRSQIRRSSNRGVSSRPGSASCRGRTRRAARSDWVRSPNRATAICGGCSSSGQRRSYARRARIPAGIPG
jgi:transposase